MRALLAAVVSKQVSTDLNMSPEEVLKKIEDHKKFVQAGKERISNEIDQKASDIKKRSEPFLELKNKMEKRGDETMEYTYLDMQRRGNASEVRRDERINDVLLILQRKADPKEVAEKYFLKGDHFCFDPFDKKLDCGGLLHTEIEMVYKECDCFPMVKEKLFNLRTARMAKKNVAEKYKHDIAVLESLSSLDDWQRSELTEKRAYVEAADKIVLNATDQELIKEIMEKPESTLAKCINRAEKAIPILVKYDGSHQLLLHLKSLKRTVDYFGIVPEVDFTIPMMVREEDKELADVPKCPNTGEPDCYERKQKPVVVKHIESWNKKYEVLDKNNQGFDYAIFTEYRHNIRGMNYQKYYKSVNVPKKN